MSESFEKPEPPLNSSPEKGVDAEVRVGIWHLTVQFLDFDGKAQMLEKDIRMVPGDTLAKLESSAVSYASGTGLHNFGMDTHYARYPQGHPVQFNLVHKDASEVTHAFIRNYNGSGYPVRPKS